MRGFGVVMLGLGITLLIASVVATMAVAQEGDYRVVLGFLACAGLVPVPMIVLGIRAVRRAEDGGNPPRHPDPAPVIAAGRNPIRHALARVRAFDLNRLNWVGWLLLL